MSGNSAESEGTRKDPSADSIRSIDTAGDNVTAFGLCSKNSNSMKSSNPHSGIYEADTTRTLDLNGGNPNCNQGGMIVLEGNGSRPSHGGDGYKKSNISYTLNATEKHGVCYSNNQVGGE